MKKIKEFFGCFVKRWKTERNFRYAVIVITLTAAAFAVDRWRKWDDSKELPQREIVEEAPEEDILQTIWDDNKAHFIAFGGLSVTLFIVRCRNEVRLRGSEGIK